MRGGAWRRRYGVLVALGGLLCARVAVAQEVELGVPAEFSVGAWVVGPQALAGSPPGVAFDGHQYLVVWVTQSTARAVLAARVRADGTVLDVPARIVAYDAEDSFLATPPAVAFDGRRFVVAWSTPSGVKVTHVEPDGTVPHPEGLYLARGDAPEGSPAIGCADGECLIAWKETGGDLGFPLMARRVRADLSSPDAAAFFVVNDGYEPSISAAHGAYLLAWTQGFELSEPKVRARLVPREAPVPFEPGFFLSNRWEGQASPHVSAFGGGWLALWTHRGEDGQAIHGTRVSPDGVVQDVEGVPLAESNDSLLGMPRAAFDGARWLLTWHATTTGASRRLGAAWLEPDLSRSVLPGVLVPEEHHPQLWLADVAAGADGFLVVWSSGRAWPPAQGFAVFGTRVGPEGVALDTPALALSSTAGTQERPAVARGGSEELLVWAETRTLAGSRIVGARIGAGGARAGAEVVLPSAPGSRRPAVSWDGSRYLVVWEEPTLDGGTDIRGARVSATGRVLDTTSLAVSTAPGDQRSPGVTFAAGRWWVVWEDTRNASGPGGSDIYGTRVRYFGEVVDPGGLRLSPAARTQRAPAVTSLGDDVFVVWEEHGAGLSGWDIRGTRVRWNGTVVDLEGLALSAAMNDQRAPAVASDGTLALVVWEDGRRWDSQVLPKVFGARVSESGLVLEPEGLPIGSTTARMRAAPTVSCDGLRFWVAWESRPSTQGVWPAHRVDVRGARVTAGGQVDLSEVGLSMRVDAELGPVLGSLGPGQTRVYYRRFVAQPAAGTERLKGRFILEPAPAAP